jgi:exonuclease III
MHPSMNILCFRGEYRCFQAEHFCLYQNLNVCGLMSKLKDPNFFNIFQNYDILFFQETKTDNLDHLSLPDGFTYVAKHRKKCLRKSGGIVTIFKKSLARLLEFPDTSSEYVQ